MPCVGKSTGERQQESDSLPGDAGCAQNMHSEVVAAVVAAAAVAHLGVAHLGVAHLVLAAAVVHAEAALELLGEQVHLDVAVAAAVAAHLSVATAFCGTTA